jgi:hypothetical protein
VSHEKGGASAIKSTTKNIWIFKIFKLKGLNMTKNIKVLSLWISTLAFLTMLACGIASTATAKPKAAPATDACTVPASPSGTQEETAWRLFVAINCKIGAGQLTWETWTTQACLNNPADCQTGARLHASALRDALIKGDNPRRTAGCSPMTTASTPPDPTLVNFLPTNLSSNPVFCEEVTINPSEEAYARSKGLLTQTGQVNYLQAGNTIDFPTDAIEVKADWVPASSFTDATFDCSNPNGKIYMEMINGTCYALAGMHISSKLYPNWLWATFEPQYSITNPNRCNPSLYNSCTDTWGSHPATSTGKDTAPTNALTELFEAAGIALDPAFRNYRLTGTQTAYNQPTTSGGALGSSFVEFNANVPAQQASCITCHSYAQRQPSPPPAGSTPPGGAPQGDANVGTPTPLKAKYKPLDFSWFLGFGVPTGSSCQDINTGPIWSNPDAQGKCANVCASVARTWNGQWKTTQPGAMSVCGCCL